ncbi:MAG: response regulator [Terasakiella sp.]|uniref:response regulator n=1 Tax=unclassified Terasakiella TaxID=2614952 RepID=UPI003AFF6837
MRVLFVDDDPNVLSALNRNLRQAHTDWNIEYANSGFEALNTMEHNEYDVIVSDMQMPEMTGEELLTQVAERHPQTAKVVLSGECNQVTAYSLVGGDHFFLAKPCSLELLVYTVTRAFEVYKKDTGPILDHDAEILHTKVNNLETGLHDFLSLLLMRNIVQLNDIPPSMHYLVSNNLLNCFDEPHTPQVFEPKETWF